MENNITYGSTWQDVYMSGVALPSSTKITLIKETNYGFIIHLFSQYVVLTYVKLYVNGDGSAKAKVKRCKNYCADEYLTYYFGVDGREIKDYLNRTRVELEEYNRQRNEYLNKLK